MKINIFFLVISFLGTTLASSGSDYPVNIEEVGDIVVTCPILDACPEGVEIHSAVIESPDFRTSMRFHGQPALMFVSLQAISAYFNERGILNYITDTISWSSLDHHMVFCLKRHLNAFNPSFLDGNSYTDDQVIVFGAVFLRLFKAAYPGLHRVKLSKLEIVFLSLIASCWFMSHEAEDEGVDLDYFIIDCLNFYYPDCLVRIESYHLTMTLLHSLRLPIAFEASYQLAAKRILKRSTFNLESLNPSDCLADFVGNREIFLKLLSVLPSINEVRMQYFNDCHVLIDMIKLGFFCPEAFRRPELKLYRLNLSQQVYFQDFYSEALYYSLQYENAEATDFLLNLDYSYYQHAEPASDDSVHEHELESETSDHSSDSDSDSSITTIDITPTPPLSIESYTILRAIFLSDSLDKILFTCPHVSSYRFCNLSVFCFIRNMKRYFPSLMILDSYFKVLFSQYESNKISGTKRERSD